MDVKLTYFKPTGKFYSEGELVVPETWYMFQIFEHVRQLYTDERLPDLTRGGQRSKFTVLVEAPDHPHAYPALIGPQS